MSIGAAGYNNLQATSYNIHVHFNKGTCQPCVPKNNSALRHRGVRYARLWIHTQYYWFWSFHELVMNRQNIKSHRTKVNFYKEQTISM